MALNLPSRALREQLLTLGRDTIDSYSFKGDVAGDPHWFAERKWFNDFATDDAGAATFHEHMLGLSALSAILWRASKPRQERYRRYAIESLDRYFEDWQVPIVTPGVSSLSNGGGLFRTTTANVAAENGTAMPFAILNASLAICALGLESRYRQQILGMCDYSKAAGERTFYTNGNINVMKAILYFMGARVSGWDAVRAADYELTMDFLWDANGTVGGSSWLGRGFIQEDPATTPRGAGLVGYFAETTSSSSSTDMSALPRYDTIYTFEQSNYASVGYLISGDLRFLRAARGTIAKVFDVGAINTTTCVLSAQVGDTRLTGTREAISLAWPMLVWLEGVADPDGFATTTITHASNGLDFEQRDYFDFSKSGFVRSIGYHTGGLILASHGVML